MPAATSTRSLLIFCGIWELAKWENCPSIKLCMPMPWSNVLRERGPMLRLKLKNYDGVAASATHTSGATSTSASAGACVAASSR